MNKGGDPDPDLESISVPDPVTDLGKELPLNGKSSLRSMGREAARVTASKDTMIPTTVDVAAAASPEVEAADAMKSMKGDTTGLAIIASRETTSIIHPAGNQEAADSKGAVHTAAVAASSAFEDE
jgi:hypothetical protein